MRFVRLNNEQSASPYTIILKNGCGPNFVLNRADAFGAMIREQGLTFWFRFWLKFCLRPGCNDLKSIQEQWPDIKCCANINIHDNFLLGSAEDAIKYCLESAIVKLKVPEEAVGETPPKVSFYSLLLDCAEMAFGAALCAMFYTWLTSKGYTKGNPNYWSVPKVYYNKKFKPGLLEHFLTKYWGENVYSLLGVSQMQLRWLDALVKRKQIPRHYENVVERTEHPMLIQYIAGVLRTHRDQRRLETEVADELPHTPKNYLTFNMYSEAPNVAKTEMQLNSKLILANGKVQMLNKCKNKTRHQCAFCRNTETVRNAYKACNSCQIENWLDIRYYCSDRCEMEHWFLKHQREHAKMESQAEETSSD